MPQTSPCQTQRRDSMCHVAVAWLPALLELVFIIAIAAKRKGPRALFLDSVARLRCEALLPLLVCRT